MSATITALDPGTGQFVSQPNIPNNTVTLQAGQTLTVDAQTMLPADNPLTTHFQWNFGDPTAAYNTLPGYNAAHVYNTPGTYQVTLTATLGSAPQSPMNTTLTVQVNTSSQQQVYVSSSGSGTGDGSSPSNTLSFLRFLNQGLTQNTEYLFEDGQTYSVSSYIYG